MNAVTNQADFVVDDFDVLIVGAGISGIAMAVHLQRDCPDKNFVMLERRAELGGTWDLFRYPCFITTFFCCQHTVHATIIKLNALPYSVRTAAENDDFLFITSYRFILCLKR